MKVIKDLDDFINEARDFTFISDDGPEPIIFQQTAPVKREIKLPRYGVWSTKGQKKLSVIDSGDDLDALLNKYELTPDDVYVMDREKRKYVGKGGKEI